MSAPIKSVGTPVNPNPTPSEAKAIIKKPSNPKSEKVSEKVSQSAHPALSGNPIQSPAPQNNNNNNNNIVHLKPNKNVDFDLHVEYRVSTGVLLETVKKTKEVLQKLEKNVDVFYANIGKVNNSDIAFVTPLKDYIPVLSDFKRYFNKHQNLYGSTQVTLIDLENQVKGVCIELTKQIASHKIRQEMRADFGKEWNECCFSNIITNYDNELLEAMLGLLPKIQGLTQEALAAVLTVRSAKGQFKYVSHPLPKSFLQLQLDFVQYYNAFVRLHNIVSDTKKLQEVKPNENIVSLREQFEEKPAVEPKKDENILIIEKQPDEKLEEEVKNNEQIHVEAKENSGAEVNPGLLAEFTNIINTLRTPITLKEDVLNSFEIHDNEKKEEVRKQLNKKLDIVNVNRKSCAELLMHKWTLLHETFTEWADQLNVVEYALTDGGRVPTDTYVKTFITGSAKVDFPVTPS